MSPSELPRCGAVLGVPGEPFVCERPVGHAGRHQEERAAYVCSWTDGLSCTNSQDGPS